MTHHLDDHVGAELETSRVYEKRPYDGSLVQQSAAESSYICLVVFYVIALLLLYVHDVFVVYNMHIYIYI